MSTRPARQGMGCGCWSGLVSAVLAAFLIAAIVVIAIRVTRGQPLPDLRAVTGSVTVRSNEQAAKSRIDLKLGELQDHARWLNVQGSSIDDGCHAVGGEGGFIGHAELGVNCYRAVAVYYAFDGAISARLAELEHALLAEGAIGLAACPPSGPVVTPPPPPEVCASLKLAANPLRDSGPIGMAFSWIRRGQRVDTSATLGVLGLKGQPDRDRYYQYKPASARTMLSRSFGAYEYALIVSIDYQYYISPPGASPPP